MPFRSVVLGLLTIQSAVGLTQDNELGGLITRMFDPTLETSYFSTLLDTAFVSYGANVLLNQAGIIKEDPTVSKATLNNMECQLTMSVGREPGTWMEKEWAASGARLALPLSIRFSDEVVDMGFPGEESLNPGGGRYAKKVYCDGGSFVGAQGEVVVRASGGAWATESSGIPGASTLNFFIDFPAEAARNDVTLPEGRVFFSGACWDSKDALPPGIIDGAIEMPDGEIAGVVEGPDGVFMLNKGGLSIKRNSFKNLWGGLGDAMFILGRYSMPASVSAETASAPTSVPGTTTTVASVAQELSPADAARSELDEARDELAKREAALKEREDALRNALGDDK